MARVRQEQLSWLRGAAATYVVLNHTRGALFIGGHKLLGSDPSPANYLSVALLQITSLGVEAVVVFFVLSGFAMAHSLSRNSNIPQFYLRRLIRIWPPCVAGTLVAAGIGLIIGKSVPMRVMFFIRPDTPLTPQFWSLPYEVLFYACCPFIIGKRLLPLAAVASLVTLILVGPMLNPWHSTVLNFVGNELLMFAVGATAFHYYDRIPKVKHFGWIFACAFVVSVFVKREMGGTNLYSNLIVCAVAVLAIRNMPELPFDFGFFTYSIYLYSYAMIALVAWYLGSSTNPILWVLAVPPVMLASYVLYLFTERPCGILLARLRGGALGHGKVQDGSLGGSPAHG